MIKKQQQFIPKGMNQDIAETKVQSDFAYKIKNLRTVTDESNGTLSLVTEKGTKIKNNWNGYIPSSEILNVTVVDKDIIVFSKQTWPVVEEPDTIYKIKNFNSDQPDVEQLYQGNLNFNVLNPIKTYVSYENKKTIKIYWIDGINQPRVINVAEGVSYESFDNDLDNHFDFCSPVYYDEIIKITKKLQGGLFHSGVIQYFMTYVDKNNQESKIFYQSPLYYLTDNDRSLSPEENSTCSFEINISNIRNDNLHRKSLRVYSLQRTSLNSTPITKLIADYILEDDDTEITIIDDNRIGSNIDPNTLLLLGCDYFVPKTMEVKDNTIFFGNIKTENYGEGDYIKTKTNCTFRKSTSAIHTSTMNVSEMKVIKLRSGNVIEEFQLNGTEKKDNREYVKIWNINGSDNEVKGFMYQEEYMLGIQFLHKTGEWSEPIWVGDKIMDKHPESNPYHLVPYFYVSYVPSIANSLLDNNYVAARPLIVFNDYTTARVLCNGVICPSIQYNNNYYTSWFFRPRVKGSFIDDATGLHYYTNEAGFSKIIYSCYHDSDSSTPGYFRNEIDPSIEFSGRISETVVSFNSPEIEFGKLINISNNYNLVLDGNIGIHQITYDSNIICSTCTENLDSKYGFQRKYGAKLYSDISAYTTFTGGELWKDATNDSTPIETSYTIYPWHNDISYSNSSINDDIVYGAPEQKTITNIRISQHPSYVSKSEEIEITVNDLKIINDKSINISTVDNNDNLIVLNYTKDVDLLLLKKNNGFGNVRVQYKSTPHIVITTNENVSSKDTSGIYTHKLPNSQFSNLLMGYLLNKDYDSSNKFKGRINGVPTETSMCENTWYIAGDIVKIVRGDDLIIRWIKGDTFYQRYNCLKTYPYSHEAESNIIDICSFMVQTRINIDGTYNKQKLDILHIEPENFNKLNNVYSQEDNFITYHKLSADRFQNAFPNLIVWSKQKIFGELIDSWTNMHLTNVLDLDGNLGEITALKLWNNKLIAFQNKGISVVKYNENVAIPQSVGAPIVLMNSGLVNGKEYLTNQFGCQNEWSIVNAKSGLYFSDDYNHKLYVLSDGIKCISDSLGFKSYLKTKNYTGTWNKHRTAGSTLKTLYDQKSGEIYFTDGIDCLAFNENLNLFTSFYDYKDIEDYQLIDFFNIENKNYWVINGVGGPKFYEHRAENYLNIFDNSYGYEIELTSNIDPHLDKVFDTVEIRGDAYINDNLQSGYGDVPPFDTLKATNEYQNTGDQPLNFVKDRPNSISNIKQKFRIWRANVGRNQNSRDRIRNYWSRIKLVKNATNNLRAKIHDIIVNVYE